MISTRRSAGTPAGRVLRHAGVEQLRPIIAEAVHQATGRMHRDVLPRYWVTEAEVKARLPREWIGMPGRVARYLSRQR